ncbi:Alcohol dehydrogenase [NADP+] A [Operophtera brumata]|uniref:Alcohol dehydrogenase [NADP+] A n=1 Tax=Operophtera brumata TaxID=104452 RepID=A0A0L7LW80_OPEBR|nr:Alcohol dehydrogenase [NADP+] A [Operophtera brumata]
MKVTRLSQTEDLMPTLGLGTWQLPHIGNRASDVKKFVDLQLQRLQLSYIDLYLIHVPFGFVSDPHELTPCVEPNGEYVLDMNTDHVQIWKSLEQCQKERLIRNLGLSNFNEKQIKKIIESATLKPQVLQVELHAYFQQVALRKFCAENNIVVTAPETFPDLLGHPHVKEIAQEHGKTPAQIMLHFLVTEQIVENMDIYDFELSTAEINILKELDKGEDGRIFNFLFWKGVEKHPEYPFRLPDIEAVKD